MQFIYVFLPALVAGIIQATTGFGAGIFMMLFFPLFLPMIQCSALSGAISIISSIVLVYQYRQYMQPKRVIVPFCFYSVFSTLCIWWSTKLDMSALKPVFGGFLLALGLYFLFFAKRIHLKGGILSAGICSSLSGCASGFFGIGGPPMVLYFLALIGDDKYAYLGTIQLFFLVTSLQSLVTRVFNGIYTWQLLLLVPAGWAGILIGNQIGTRIVRRLPVDKMKIVIYAFLCLAGLTTIIANL